jgi:hypothetical protein
VIVAVVRLVRPTTTLSLRLALAVAVGAYSISPSVPIAKSISEVHRNSLIWHAPTVHKYT